MHKIVAINPGATSTKISYYEDDKEIFVEKIEHSIDELKKYEHTWDQYEFRGNVIADVLSKKDVDIENLSAVVGRGGPFKPLVSGTYLVDSDMMSDVREGKVQADHISNLGCLLANEIAQKAGCKAYIVDPVSVDEFIPEARISGIPDIERRSLAHALNIKMVAKKFAKKVGRKYEDMNLVIAHLGGGITISSHKKGRMIDVNNANDEGPFSPQRAGTLPITQLAKLCYSGKYKDYPAMKKRLIKEGGMHAYLGIEDLRDIKIAIDNGDEKARLHYSAMGYQIAKYIGAYAAVLDGDVDAILLTGGIAYNESMLGIIIPKIKWIADVEVFAGEDEMEGLTLGVLRVLNGEEEVKKY
ncbi:MAG: butyrate kinase [Candidatus Zixiibacteriota bacterium]